MQYESQYGSYPTQPEPPGRRGQFPPGAGNAAYGGQGYYQPPQYGTQLPPSTSGSGQYQNHIHAHPPSYANQRQFGGQAMPPPSVAGPPQTAYGQGYPPAMGGQQFMPGQAGKAAPAGGPQPFSFSNPWSMLSSVSQMGTL
jgi:hypothetical protein